MFDPDTKAYLKTRRLTDTLPAQMAAVYLYTQSRTTLLALDFDSKTHGRGQVDADSAQAREWLESCGARLISDQSTNGGRHILVPLAIGTTASIDEIKPLMHQLKARLRSLDITPMLNPSEGCISVPGTPCRGGHRQLDGSLIHAVNALTERSNPTLLPELYVLLGTLPPSPASAARTSEDNPHTIGIGDDERLIEKHYWTKPIGPEVIEFAVKGDPFFELDKARCAKAGRARRWRSRSEARMSVIFNAVIRGSSLADIRRATRPGQTWAGLGDSYRNKYGPLADRQLERDVHVAFRSAQAQIPKANPPAHRVNYPQPGVARWLSYALSWADHEFHGSPLRWTVRDVLQALAVKAALAGENRSGTTVVGVGGRSLSLSAGLLPPTTVFDALRRIRPMVGSPILLVRPRIGRDADHYALTATNPDNLTPVPLDRVLVQEVHPAWSVLGRQHRLIYELIAQTGLCRPADIYAAARVSARTGQLTLAALATAGLVTRTGRTVAVGSVSLDDIAAAHHLHESFAERVERFRRERAAWHAWLALQEELRGLATPADCGQESVMPAAPVLAHEQEYLAAVLAQGPPDAGIQAEEHAALELLADLLGARILTAAGPS